VIPLLSGWWLREVLLLFHQHRETDPHKFKIHFNRHGIGPNDDADDNPTFGQS
jgi:hypothetical protein